MIKLRYLPLPLAAILCLSTNLQAEKLPLAMVTNAAAEIDYTIEQANAAKEIKPNSIVDDATFLRRSYINIIGRIPTIEETKKFLDDKSESKRVVLTDKLIYSPGFSSHLFNFYANLLRLQTAQDQFGLGWHIWLNKSVKSNKGYDKMVFEMLSASGHCSTTPQAGYFLRDRGMLLDNVSNTSKIFLGTQIGCAQCHDHPFEDWTQKQYYELAAFGSQIDFKSALARKKVKEAVDYRLGLKEQQPYKDLTKKQRKERQNLSKTESRDLYSLFKNFSKNEVTHTSTKSLKLPQDYKYNDGKPGDAVSPHILFGQAPKIDPVSETPPHEQLAKWVTSRTNPMFTKVYANRLWKHALGYGLVEPLDNWTDRSNISHPEVLDLLVQILHSTDFDTREVLRVIYHTKLFQRSVCNFEISDGRVHDFRGPLLRRMSAEEIYDSLLTLEKGNLDGVENKNQLNKWQSYQKSISLLVNATPEQLDKLDDQADVVEDSTRKYQIQARELRTEKEVALNEGKEREANQIQKKLTRLYTTINEVRQKTQSEENKKVSMATMNNLRVRSNQVLRASEMPTPFRPGSFARDFGASDRNTTDAQHTYASIPQALVMLNGIQVDNITNKSGKLAQLMKHASTDEQRLNALFLSIYNSYPTLDEQRELKMFSRSRQDIKILAKSMLNSKRFLFVQ